MLPKFDRMTRLIPFLLIFTAILFFYYSKQLNRSLKDLEATVKNNQVNLTDITQLSAITTTPEVKNANGVYLNSPIILTGLVTKEGIQLYWRTNSTDTSYGFGVAQSLKRSPVFPDDEHVELADGGARSYLWKIADGQTHYFRVCQFLENGQCGRYSNNLWLKTARPILNAAQSIDLTGSGTAVRWAVSGYSEKGFALVWSKEPGPVYPARTGDKYLIFSDPDHSGAVVEPYAGDGFYYVRVCEYLNGKCGVYSNELELTL